MSDQVRIGVIGGTGLYQIETIRDVKEHKITTPYGKPSDNIMTGVVAGERVAFLSRHGRGHLLNPTEVPYRANIYALKTLGVEYIIGVSACGSLREEMAPGHIVIPDQVVDFTKGLRARTFFEEGIVAHVGVADPFCETLRGLLADGVERTGKTVHRNGTIITVEGPRFSTRAESFLFRQWGMDIIGMTTSPEAFLAREAEICYATMAIVTDYDVWHEHEVTVEMVFANFKGNLEMAKQVLTDVVPQIAAIPAPNPIHSALKGTLTTAADKIAPAQQKKLRPFMKNLLG